MIQARAASRRRDEAGFLSVEYMMAAAFSLLFLVMMLNLVIVQYGRGVVRAAVDEGARAGALVVDNPVERCDTRARSMLENIGKLGTAGDVQCTVNGDQVEAKVSVEFAAWLPGIPTMTENATAVSRKEQAPT